MIGSTLKLKWIPLNSDVGLLILRVLVGLILLLKHGWEKIFSFSDVVSRVPDILHIGVAPTIALAAVSDVLCAILVAVGLATRWACTYAFVVIFVAWSLRDNFKFFGRGGDHGELIALYLSALLAIFFTGPGRYSVDALFKEKK